MQLHAEEVFIKHYGNGAPGPSHTSALDHIHIHGEQPLSPLLSPEIEYRARLQRPRNPTMPPAAALIKYKGYADILTGSILAIYPNLIYHSFITRTVAALSGLHLSNARAAPGFNHAIACMVIAIGVGHVFAARSGPAGRAPLFAMNATWALLALLTCLTTPRVWRIGSATLLLSGINHLFFSLVLWIMEPGLLQTGRRVR